MEALRQGQKVRIKSTGKLGRVNYVRLAPPTYSEPQAYSVILDEVTRPGYSGTMYAASDVEPAE